MILIYQSLLVQVVCQALTMNKILKEHLLLYLQGNIISLCIWFFFSFLKNEKVAVYSVNKYTKEPVNIIIASQLETGSL